MKKFVSVVAMCLIAMPAMAATNDAQSRRSMRGQMVMSAPRAVAVTNTDAAGAGADDARTTASVKQINAIASVNTGVALSDTNKSSVRVEPDDPVPVPEPTEPDVDNREKERAACINNNIGIGNTFVWASRYSNTANYATMVEDVEEPENNVCFVKVDIKSTNPKVSVSDVPSKYFVMGNNITCGDWADEETLRQRVLDSKKSARTWATVGGVVGGAGLGVGLMEWFGNEMIGGRVEGQNALTGDELLRSQLLVLKNDSPSEFDDIKDALEILADECDSDVWNGAERPDECEEINYQYLLNAIKGV